MKKNIAKLLLVMIVFTQLFGAILTVRSIPKAQAFTSAVGIATKALGGTAEVTSVPGVERFSWHTFLNDAFKNVMLGIAYTFAQHFMQSFVNKLTEKYKIRNFLYYDQVLTDYYLTNFIRDKIADPDLQDIFVLMNDAYITGNPTYTRGGPPPDKAVIPRLKAAINKLYTEQTGVNPTLVVSKPADMSNSDYTAMASSFYFNNVGYTESNLRGQLGGFQSGATTASQLEVIVGNSLKAGRYVGGYCEIAVIDESAGNSSAIATLAQCEAAGGEWQESAVDQARSFIDNPTAYVDKWMNSAVMELGGTNFDPNNFWFVIGNAFGRFLTNRLFLDKEQGVLDEDPRAYVPASSNLGAGTTAGAAGDPIEDIPWEETPIPPAQDPGDDGINDIDSDGDGNVDGYDNDSDGLMDYCIYGGSPPECVESSTAL